MCHIIDLKLPDLDGNSLIKQINDSYSGPILAISGGSNNLSLVATKQIGADYNLSKPFEPDELIIECKRLMSEAAKL